MLLYPSHSNTWTPDEHKASVSNYVFSTRSLELEIPIPESLHLTRRQTTPGTLLGLLWDWHVMGKLPVIGEALGQSVP